MPRNGPSAPEREREGGGEGEGDLQEGSPLVLCPLGHRVLVEDTVAKLPIDAHAHDPVALHLPALGTLGGRWGGNTALTPLHKSGTSQAQGGMREVLQGRGEEEDLEEGGGRPLGLV